ncbi:MAG: hypothetical protein QXR17_08660 [Candidatus Bathyarchaeia archaeon]
MKQIERNNRLAEGTSKPFCDAWIVTANRRPRPLYFNNIFTRSLFILILRIC